MKTHYICRRCGNSFYIVTDKKKLHYCERCNQRYFLVPTKYGGLMTIEKGNIIYTDIFSSIKENLN